MTDETPTFEAARYGSKEDEGKAPPREDPVGEVIASNLRAWRQRRSWSLENTAKRLSPFLDADVSASSLQQWETTSPPRRFTFHEMYAVCRVFEQPLAVLVMPDMQDLIEPPYPTINGDPYGAIWRWCFQPMHPEVFDPRTGTGRIRIVWGLLNEVNGDGSNGDS
jgi:hypothetical protein